MTRRGRKPGWGMIRSHCPDSCRAVIPTSMDDEVICLRQIYPDRWYVPTAIILAGLLLATSLFLPVLHVQKLFGLLEDAYSSSRASEASLRRATSVWPA